MAKRVRLSQAEADNRQGRAEKLPRCMQPRDKLPRGLHHCIEGVLNFVLTIDKYHNSTKYHSV